MTEPDKVETELLGSQMKEQDPMTRNMIDFRNELNDLLGKTQAESHEQFVGELSLGKYIFAS